MISPRKIKSVDFYRKIPRDLTEASLSGAGLSIVAALSMLLLFGMELSSYLTVSTTTSIIIDRSSDGDFLRMDFNISFPSLSCEFASVDVSDVLGTNRLNVTKTIRKFSIDSNLRPTGSEFHSGEFLSRVNHGDESAEELVEGSVSLGARNFDTFLHQYPISVVNFYAPWCYWCNLLKPSWEKAANQIKERYDPEMDGRVILAKVDCTQEADLCRRNHIQGYPSIRIFRKGSDLRDDNAHHDHESYYGDRDTESLVKMVIGLVEPIHVEPHKLALEDKSDNASKTLKKAPSTGGCQIEGYMRVKKVPGNLMVSARSESHSFDTSQMNMSHVVNHLSFGKRILPEAFSNLKRLAPYLGGSHNRLDDRSFINQHDLGPNVTIEHYLQIVKTEVLKSNGHAMIEEYEYTAHSSVAHTYYLPVAKFHFELSAMQVLITENSKSFSHFITNVCAIIGGVFTVAGILDSILHQTMTLMKKIELGKNF
ncbi:hypothetical protein BRARA_H01526 [Brassica rapa]|uniref:BnaA08g14160D protein n=3 Tax=Brassica TaxID=3705 RepID=A0A078FIL8_BRANA|nr:protein disulfide-isomerase 5-4 [Brassica napus]KAH0915592.1 hypothetical protein HID58_030038 [Brassica napus]RID50824.1 hypothetical protein BRARA_H01526 [Brassica rapa]CAF2245267.1 unnamed protein product [Brassica napus]CDY14285.1 BnaA08g14160D [Brassica napus]